MQDLSKSLHSQGIAFANVELCLPLPVCPEHTLFWLLRKFSVKSKQNHQLFPKNYSIKTLLLGKSNSSKQIFWSPSVSTAQSTKIREKIRNFLYKTCWKYLFSTNHENLSGQCVLFHQYLSFKMFYVTEFVTLKLNLEDFLFECL